MKRAAEQKGQSRPVGGDVVVRGELDGGAEELRRLCRGAALQREDAGPAEGCGRGCRSAVEPTGNVVPSDGEHLLGREPVRRLPPGPVGGGDPTMTVSHFIGVETVQERPSKRLVHEAEGHVAVRLEQSMVGGLAQSRQHVRQVEPVGVSEEAALEPDTDDSGRRQQVRCFCRQLFQAGEHQADGILREVEGVQALLVQDPASPVRTQQTGVDDTVQELERDERIARASGGDQPWRVVTPGRPRAGHRARGRRRRRRTAVPVPARARSARPVWSATARRRCCPVPAPAEGLRPAGTPAGRGPDG